MTDKPERLRAEAREIREQAGLTSFAPDRAALLGMAERCEREAASAEGARLRFLVASEEVATGGPPGEWGARAGG